MAPEREAVKVAGLDFGLAPAEKAPAMSVSSQSESVEIDAPREVCAEVLLDFERYPEWSGPITEARVLERDGDGRARRVAFALDMRIRTVRYTLEYAYDLPECARWHLVEGDLAAVDGRYELEELGPGRTRATCTQAVDLGFWVPGPIRRLIEGQALRSSVAEFKAEAERRARS